MKDRVYIKDLGTKVGEEVAIAGWIDVRRDHGKLIFIDLRDASGSVQMVVLSNNAEAHGVAETVRPEWVVRVEGVVNRRPEKMVKEGLNGDIEVEVKNLRVLGSAKELPFEKDADLNIDTIFDYLPLTLRTEKRQAIFRLQAILIQLFREFFIQKHFVEIQAPKLIGDDAEGGANSFNVEYFKHTAHLAQSPQFYKQIMVGVFERVFATGNVYRAEKHATTRHLNEYTSLDIEMGFIESFRDVMRMENELLLFMVPLLVQRAPRELVLLGATLPTVPKEIPALTLREAQALISKETGEDCTKEPDLDPAHERWLCEYSQKTFDSEFIFITHFPLSKRPMYTYGDPENPGYAAGFDLLFRGVEITTGGQRIHEYDDLVAEMSKRGLDPEKFRFYLQAFKYGMPPHGGFGLGLERLTSKLLGIENVKEATLFPRDLNRIDTRLAE